MPAPGDQHRRVTNPFEEHPARISEYTAKEIATLQSRLERQLGPEYISARSGPSGQKVHYVAAEKCIQLANEVFGFNGWSSSLQNIQVDFADEKPDGRVSLGLSVVMRVTLRDGTYHEDIGYGQIENCKSKAMAFEKAKKEGTTDGLKRALRNFGNVLGNCIYDKEYLKKVVRIKPAPVRFDEANLHRHGDLAVKKEADLATIKKEKAEEIQVALPQAEDFDLLDDFGDIDDADLCIHADDHPDEVTLPQKTGNNPSDKFAAPNTSAPVVPPSRATNAKGRPPQTPNNYVQQKRPPGPQGGQAIGQQARPIPPHQRPSSVNPTGPSGPNAQSNQPSRPPLPQTAGGSAAPAPLWFSAKAIQEIPESSLVDGMAIKAQQIFNPKAESPSIRKTEGFDHSSSKPIVRAAVVQQPPTPPTGEPGNVSVNNGTKPAAAMQQQVPRTGNVVNPHLDQTRQVGAPGGRGSPLANRGQYRPPSMKRPLEAGGGNGRPALAEVTSNTVVGVGQNVSELDAKRQKMG